MPRSQFINKGRCLGICQDFEHNRGQRLSKFPGLAELQKKCKTCNYWCYRNEIADYCPCCKYSYTMVGERR